MDHHYVNIHTHRRTGEGIELVSSMVGSGNVPEPPCSVGIHPWQVGGNAKGEIMIGELTLEQALHEIETAQVNAIGEIGLDYSRPIPRQLQIEVFESQLRIAYERKLPVIIHCVRAFEPVMEILAKYSRGEDPLFHGFIGSLQQAQRATKAGCYLSFGERSFASPKTVEAMRSIPFSRLFLETDDSDMSIEQVYRQAARLLDTDVDLLKEEIYTNYLDFLEPL